MKPVLVKLKEEHVQAIISYPVKAAEAVSLIYVSDSKPGIVRRRRGKSFVYLHGKSRLTDKDELARIKKLAIPPAWKEVWICRLPEGHLQATGIDVLGRKQYKYHAAWSALRNETKFFRLYKFGHALPSIRKRLNADLAKKGIPKEKVLALVVKLMELTNIRIGNNSYEKLYGSFGLTTLKDRHVKLNGSKVGFSFKGKKGIEHNINIRSKRFAKLIKMCRDIPGKELFQYIDETGERRTIDSGTVNSYIREISGNDFTAKDFRTWAGTTQALAILKDAGVAASAAEAQRKIIETLDTVSRALGNSRAICKKYYVHPGIIKLYESNILHNYFGKSGILKSERNLLAEERLLLEILKKEKL